MLTQPIPALTLLWAGMILGISFLESWVKFRAPSLSKAVGLDVGRTVFNFFHKAQCILLSGLILIGMLMTLTLVNWLMLGMLTAVFILQLTWPFPILSQHVTMILAGKKPPHSQAHVLYGILEVAKFLILIGFSVLS
ncbi:MAG: hypothetical protein WAW86_04525 [Gammaproteobacteria bacterium]